MLKSVLKETIIILLLILAIVLVLGVFLYDYIPTNKVVPKIEQYQVPDNVKEEIEQNENLTEEKTQPIVYEITNSDLKIYEKTKEYNKGKINPFEVVSTNSIVDGQTGQTTNPGDNTGNGTSGGNNSNTQTQTNPSGVTSIK